MTRTAGTTQEGQPMPSRTAIARRVRVSMSAVLLLGACAGSVVPNAGAHPAASQRTVSLHVDNQNWSDVRVYVHSGTTRVFLGTVDGFSKRSLHVPRVLQSGAFEAVPIGGALGWMSRDVAMDGDRRFELRLATNIKHSALEWR